MAGVGQRELDSPGTADGSPLEVCSRSSGSSGTTPECQARVAARSLSITETIWDFGPNFVELVWLVMVSLVLDYVFRGRQLQ
mmetsp:Transcript_2412/g.7315  ORF Transcript_2412/g.7315 Transcript_2412/m.7315 type:complete len:82 (-) Transcript_2412:354-599(-)